MAEMMAARNALTATPESNSAAIEKRPPTEATANTRPRAPAAPAKAMTGSASAEAAGAPMAIATTAPSAPPVDTPMMPGSAIGLRNRPLHHRAGHAEGGADDQRQGDAGQSDRLDDGALGVAGRDGGQAELLQQDAGGVGERDRVRSDGGRGHDQRRGTGSQQGAAACQPRHHRRPRPRGHIFSLLAPPHPELLRRSAYGDVAARNGPVPWG